MFCKIESGETGYKKITLRKTIGMCLELSYRYTPGEIKVIFYKYVGITGYSVGNRSGYLPNTCLEEYHNRAPHGCTLSSLLSQICVHTVLLRLFIHKGYIGFNLRLMCAGLQGLLQSKSFPLFSLLAQGLVIQGEF